MKHNEIAAIYRQALKNRNISVDIEPWDKIIFEFARDNKNSNIETEVLLRKIVASIRDNLKLLNPILQKRPE